MIICINTNLQNWFQAFFLPCVVKGLNALQLQYNWDLSVSQKNKVLPNKPNTSTGIKPTQSLHACYISAGLLYVFSSAQVLYI